MPPGQLDQEVLVVSDATGNDVLALAYQLEVEPSHLNKLVEESAVFFDMKGYREKLSLSCGFSCATRMCRVNFPSVCHTHRLRKQFVQLHYGDVCSEVSV